VRLSGPERSCHGKTCGGNLEGLCNTAANSKRFFKRMTKLCCMLKRHLKAIKSLLKSQYMRRTKFHYLDKQYKAQFFANKLGLEIGGPSSIFSPMSIIPIYHWASSIDNVNFSNSTVWSKTTSDQNFLLKHRKAEGKQIISECTNLSAIKDQSYDFVVSSHVLEHTANPIKALNEWKRVVRDNGILFVVCPHKEGTFDHFRPSTDLSHLIADFNENKGEADLSHLEEILNLHDLSMDPAAGSFEDFLERSRDNYKCRCLHHHTFTTESVIRLFDYLDIEIIHIDTYLPYHIFILGKVNRNTSNVHPSNQRHLMQNAKWRQNSCFVLDQQQ